MNVASICFVSVVIKRYEKCRKLIDVVCETQLAFSTTRKTNVRKMKFPWTTVCKKTRSSFFSRADIFTDFVQVSFYNTNEATSRLTHCIFFIQRSCSSFSRRFQCPFERELAQGLGSTVLGLFVDHLTRVLAIYAVSYRLQYHTHPSVESNQMGLP